MEKLRTETAWALLQCSAQHNHSPNLKQGFAGASVYAYPENRGEFVSANVVYVFRKK